MSTAAATVVNAVAARLLPVALTGGRVKTSRTWPWAEAELPAWRVYAQEEPVDTAELGGINVHRLLIQCDASARATADLDDALEALSAAGQAAIFAAPVPYSIQLEGIDRAMSTEGEASVGVLSLSLRATYYVHPAAPNTIVSA